MQEPKRNNVLNSLTKSFNIANRKSFLHNLIYIIKRNDLDTDLSSWRSIYENKILNNDRIEDSLNGMCFYILEYVICVIEGSEDNLNKHIRKLVVQREYEAKVLVFIPHILKINFIGWQSFILQPSILLDTIDVYMNPTEHAAKVKQCVIKILKLSEYLSYMSENVKNEGLENILETCKNVIPEVALLEFLMVSPLLPPIEYYYQNQRSPQPYQLYHDLIWPLPDTFVPTISSQHLDDH